MSHTIHCSESSRTFSVVEGQIPDDLILGLCCDFSREELDVIYARVNKTLAKSVNANETPIALWIFGPSAVGKSTLGASKCRALFKCEQNAVIIDGAEFRTCHAGFQSVATHGHEHGLLHADAWKTFKDAGRRASRVGGSGETAEAHGCNGWSGTLKRRLLKEALRDRQNVVIPDCANHPSRLKVMLDDVKSAGYGMHALILWAPLSETRLRGEERSLQEGKLWSPKEYEKCTRGSLALAMRWVDGMRDEPASFCGLEMWDNSVFPATECGMGEFAARVYMTDAEADAHAVKVASVRLAEHTQTAQLNRTGVGNVQANMHRKSFQSPANKDLFTSLAIFNTVVTRGVRGRGGSASGVVATVADTGGGGIEIDIPAQETTSSTTSTPSNKIAAMTPPPESPAHARFVGRVQGLTATAVIAAVSMAIAIAVIAPYGC